MTWRAGIDILSYGATKNGGMCAEGVVIFNRDLNRQQVGFLRRRNGQLYSKMRYLSVQLHALIRNGVAEKNARNAQTLWPGASQPACRQFPVRDLHRPARKRGGEPCRARLHGDAAQRPQRPAIIDS
jgi:hypothetical protein